jgi:predicted house-cleaning noncanonical NTP pyrophosphatase (MazG superfamily)
MTNHNTDPGSGGVPVWEQLAQDPEVMAAELRVGELSELDSERFRLECHLGDHYWNTGVPYVTVTSRPSYGIGSDASRYSFYWDRPMQDYERQSRGIFKTRKGQFLNDETRKFGELNPVDDEISIGMDGGKAYFVKDGKHVVSPGYDSIQPLGEREFIVTQGGRAVVAKLLNEDEREAVLEKRKRYGEIMEHFSENRDEELALQQSLAEKVLGLYGVDKEDVDIFQFANAAH